MGLFKNKELERRELKDYNEKIRVIFNDGIPDVPQNTICEVAISDEQIVINPLVGPEHKIYLNISQIKSVSVLPWGEYALKYQHTTISIPKNSPGRIYLVISFQASDNTSKIISFWGSLQFIKFEHFSDIINAKITSNAVYL
nr:hypothetical protein [uncultured Caproiciproducens sp.]